MGRIGDDVQYPSSGVFNVVDVYNFLRKTNYVATVLSDSPVGFWMLNESAGNTAFDEAGSYNLTYNNAPTLDASGPSLEILKAVTFNGTNQNATGNNSGVFTNSASGNWSLEIWLNYTSSSTAISPLFVRNTNAASNSVTGGIICNSPTVGVISGQAATPGGFVQINSGGGLNDGNWKHVVLTAETAGSLRLYINGTEVASTSTGRNTTSSERSITVASNRGGISSFSQFFPGSLAACAVYDTTLTQARVQAHYFAGE